ncbi:MAG: CpsB/CapC family capsule biosynthesis tyrosine phosphatase [Chitinophagaceae bacterium]
MFSIFKRKSDVRPDLSLLATDMHSHLIPGIDDGAQEMEDSIELVKGLEELGFSKLITTPHILWDIFKNDVKTITPPYKKLLEELKKNKIKIPIQFAAEYFLDDHVDELLEKEIPLLTLKSNLTLIEFSFVSVPLNLKEKLFDLQIAGYSPILAHPERYTYFLKDRSMYDELKESGYRFQVNLLSLTGYYGKAPQELAQYLIKKKYVDLLGTDLHHIRHLQSLQSAPQLTDIIKSLLDTGNIINPSL